MDAESYTVDYDPELRYEKLTLSRKFFDLFFIAFLNILPGGFNHFIRKSNDSAREVIDNKTTHQALEVLYNHGFPKKNQSLLQKIFLKIWFGVHNSRAVRNRLKLVRREISEAIKAVDKVDDDIRIVSIASGSARAVLEALAGINPRTNRISALFLDKNAKALEYSKFLKSEIINFKNDWKFDWVEDTAGNFTKYINGENTIDLVEMVGLLDYFEVEKAFEILSKIYKSLCSGGTMIAANITNNKERKFITNVVGWPMIYKEPDEMIKIAERAGFARGNIRAVYEPLKIHIVIIAKK